MIAVLGGLADVERELIRLDLSDNETAALTKELGDITRNDRCPFSERIRTFDLFAIVKQVVDARAQFRSLAEPA